MRGFILMDLMAKKINDFFLRPGSVLILVLTTYVAISLILIPYYKYLVNGDAIAYISIANHYLSGNLSYAINGYWGPLYSWLLIPFIYVWPGEVQTLLSARILAVILGIFTIIGFKLLIDKFDLESKIKILTLVSSLPIILYFVFNDPTPDLLVVCLLIYYLNTIMDSRYRSKVYMGLFSGLFGALAYLSKSYAFFFFIIHFSLTNIYYIRSFPLKRKIIAKNFALGLIIFFIISGAWIGAISAKYGYFTIGTAGSYNHAKIGPESKGNPIDYEGLFQPPNPYAISIWEDPTYLNIKKWNPIESSENIKHQIAVFSNNLLILVFMLESFSILSLLIIVLGIILYFKTSRESKRQLTVLLGTIILYLGGYSVILLEARYIWLVYLLLLLQEFTF